MTVSSTAPAHATVDRLAGMVVEALRGHAGAGRPVAVIDFPNHPNVGDTAIWLGELAALRALGAKIAYVAEYSAFSEESLRRAVPTGATVFLTGGGNFGDLWPPAQEIRERAISGLQDYKIVQLPQSMHFADRSNLERAQAVIDAHPDLTLMWRDRHSYELGAKSFAAQSELCPDVAFALGRQERSRPTTPMLWLSRTDTERKGERLHPSGDPDAVVVDWLTVTPSDVGWSYRHHLLSRLSERALSPVVRRPSLARFCRPLVRRVYDRLGRQRLRLGLSLLSSAEVVVTDRLHGHILCLLLGVPHVVVDNGPGKITDFLSTWTGRDRLVRVAQDSDDAVEAGRQLLRQARTTLACGAGAVAPLLQELPVAL